MFYTTGKYLLITPTTRPLGLTEEDEEEDEAGGCTTGEGIRPS